MGSEIPFIPFYHQTPINYHLALKTLTSQVRFSQELYFFKLDDQCHSNYFLVSGGDDDDDDEPTIEQCKKYIKSCPHAEKGEPQLGAAKCSRCGNSPSKHPPKVKNA